MNESIITAYNQVLVEEEKKYSYDGTRFVNRPPTPEEETKAKALADKWKRTATQPMSDYVKTIKGDISFRNKETLDVQGEETPENAASKKRATEYKKKHSFGDYYKKTR